MVAPQDDDRFLGQPEAVEFIQHAAHLRVHVADRRKVAMFQLAGEVIGNGARGNSVIAAQFAAGQHRIIRRSFGREGIRREPDRGRVVQVPVLLRSDERQMRPDETDAQPKRLVLLGTLGQRRHRHVGQRAVVKRVVRHVGAFEGRAARAAAGGLALLRLGSILRRCG